MQKRIGHLKAKQQEEYQQTVMKAAEKIDILFNEVTKHAGEFINFDLGYFEASMQEAWQDSALRKQMQTDEENQRI